jgi:WD domain, G-beta repeat
VSGSFKGVVYVWEVVSGCCIATPLGHKARKIRCVDISPCGAIVASCSGDTTARIWRLKDNVWLRPIVKPYDKKVNCIVLSADGSRAITGVEGGVVRVWDAETGVLCQPTLRWHNTGITTLALECSKATSGNSGRCGRGTLDTNSRGLENNLKQLRAGSRSPRETLCVATRDASGTCLLWNWPCEDPGRSSFKIPFERPLQHVFFRVLDLTETSCWHEQRYWWKDRPDAFTLCSSTEASVSGCKVGRGGRFKMLEVLPCAPRPDGCECVARVELDSVILKCAFYAFEILEGGVLKTIACCGLHNGTMACLKLCGCQSNVLSSRNKSLPNCSVTQLYLHAFP